ncbi:hypothetical protein [uncultured Lamprocystis sp.]|jgi:hypothetical protein|uniref:hypothetical protein n=1 Tax=uncultured Lamprocystis sp. TaxID=543132 RepID=UPI0025F75A0D|nr:hypothetical protein [uncultured Lamprocystis sp.]
MPVTMGRREYDPDGRDLMRILGQIEGRLGSIEAGLDETKDSVLRVNDRLDAHTASVARGGSLYGGVVALGVSLIAEFVKRGVPIP